MVAGVLAVLLGPVLALLGGCGAAQPTPDQARWRAEPIVEPLGGFPASQWALEASPESHELTTDPAGLRVRLKVRQPLDADGRTWRIVEGVTADDGQTLDEAGLSVLRLVVDMGGNLRLAGSEDLDEKTATEFDPPMLVYPASLSPGERLTEPLRMVVRPIADRSRIRAQGPAKREVEYVGDELVTTPMGTFQARRVKSTLTAELGPARVQVVSETWLAEGAGVVHEQQRETVTTFGVPIRQRAMSWVVERRGPGSAEGLLSALERSSLGGVVAPAKGQGG